MLDSLDQWATALAGSPWILAIILAFVIIDAFFPPVPSESLIIAVAALSAASGGPSLWLLVLVAAVGAFVGDLIAYAIGAKINVRRLRFMRSRQMQAAFAWADRALTQRPAPLIIAARYIPVGRVAVNMTAGTLRYPLTRFVPLAGIAAVTWAGYSTIIGVGAGAWLHEQPVLAVVLGVVGGTLIGFVVDWVLGRVLRVRSRGHASQVAEPAVAEPAGAQAPELVAVAARR